LEILITGASGLLGHHLISALLERGDHVRALVLPAEDATKMEARGVHIYRGDVRQPDTLTAPCSGADTIFHLAGMMGVWLPLADYRAVNVDGAEYMCRAALRAGARRLVHVSSWTVYGMTLGQPAREEFPLNPFPEPYAISKAEGDRMVQRLITQENVPAVIVRPGTFFGPGDRLHFGRMADRLRAGRGIVVGNGRNALPFVYVTDVVQGLLLTADRDAATGQAYNITNDEPLTQEEFLRAIAAELEVPAPRLRVPYAVLYAAAYAAERAAAITHAKTQPIVTRLGVKLFGTDNRQSIEKARSQLGYAPQVPLREGIRLAAEWYRQGAPALTTAPSGVA
jgi:nucleoside-diphosphate-sugar epimerase